VTGACATPRLRQPRVPHLRSLILKDPHNSLLMARLARPEPSSDGEAATTPRAESSRQAAVDSSISPSPVASFSSDKENRTRQSNASSKRKSSETGHPDSSTPATESSSATTNKRRRLTEQKGKAPQSQTAHEKQLEEVNDTEFYDPDQNPEERRAVRKGLRDLTKDLNGKLAAILYSPRTDLIKHRFAIRVPPVCVAGPSRDR
jgi:hypothetical protein